MKKYLIAIALVFAGLIGTHSAQAAPTPVNLGGTGTSTIPSGSLPYGFNNQNIKTLPIGTIGKILQSTGSIPAWVATSTLGLGTVTSVDLSVPTGLTVSGNPITGAGTLAITLTAGYNIPLSASTTNWNNFYNTPSTRITAGTGLTWSGNTLNCNTATGSVQGCLTAADWTTFNNKGSGSVTSVDMTVPTGLAISGNPITTSGTLALSLGAGYNIPLTASTTNWNSVYNNVLSRLVVSTGTAGTIFNISTSTNTLTINLPIASASNTGQLSATDFGTFNNKQATISVTAPITLTGASVGVVNQGTTVQVLHGNAAGNASFGSVVNGDIANSTIDLTAKVTGVLPIANGGTATATTPTVGQMLLGNSSNGYNLVATSTLGLGASNIQIFTNTTTPTTWTKPAGAVSVEVWVIGAGGGGGSGRRGAAASNSYAGAAGAGAGVSMMTFNASDLTATTTVTVGAGGAGGAAKAVDSSSGAAGGTGGTSNFGTYLYATGGAGGNGGTTGGAGGNGMGLGNISWQFGGICDFTSGVGITTIGCAMSGTTGVGSSGTLGASQLFLYQPGNGSSGGGITNGNVASDGGTGNSSGTHNLSGGTAGVTAGPVNAGNGQQLLSSWITYGSGGGGGAATTTAASGSGGNGGNAGAGGGGGGASRNGFNSGAGGNGADGRVVVITR